MPHLALQSQTLTARDILDVGIRDFLLHETNDGAVLYAVSGPLAGVSAYRVADDGALDFFQTSSFQIGLSDAVLPHLRIMESHDGPALVIAGGNGAPVTSLPLASDGRMLDATPIVGLHATEDRLRDFVQLNDSFWVGATGSRLVSYQMSSSGNLIPRHTFWDNADSYVAGASALLSISTFHGEFAIVSSADDSGITALKLDGHRLLATGHQGADQGLGMMSPTAMTHVELGGRDFILATSSPRDGSSASGSISVLELQSDGSLLVTDHVMDTQETRFGRAQSLDVSVVGGRAYVVTAGADGGISLLELLPHGRLLHHGSTIETGATNLATISAISTVAHATGISAYAASEQVPGIATFQIDLSSQGSVVTLPGSAGPHTGTDADDLIIGTGLDDTISGGIGDDILEDGAGRDLLTGGRGRDIFILRGDREADVITDFTTLEDRLDLSDWPFLYDTSQLSITPTQVGASVTWRGETLELYTSNGTSLTADQVRASLLITPQRPPTLAEIGQHPEDQLLEGSQEGEQITGGLGDDTIYGYGGDDTLKGGSESDVLRGGAGGDQVFGGSASDELSGDDGADGLFGGDGGDTLRGGSDEDTLHGGDGNDLLYGDLGHDHLYGGVGDDDLEGDAGDDALKGGIGQDSLDGGGGNDRLYGGKDADSLLGGDGDDLLTGGADGDTLEGGDGDDHLLGEGGSDTLRGGDGEDRLLGGAMADYLYGNAGDDLLKGHSGDDSLSGGSGRDQLLGGPGNDDLLGNGGYDTLNGGAGNDWLEGQANADVFVFCDGHGTDTIADFDALNGNERIDLSGLSGITQISDLLGPDGAGQQHGADVFLSTGPDSGIWLLSTDLDDLDASDFLF